MGGHGLARPVRLRRRELERALEAVPPHPAPRPELEQYRTPADVAAGLLWAALEAGDVAGRRVLDLGCGTGMFSLGAALCGAQEVLGVDVDPASVEVARSVMADRPEAGRVRLKVADLAEWRPGAWDTVVMNPPFGAQRGNRRGDRTFYERAAQAVRPEGSVWFLAQPVSERFLAAYARELGASVERVEQWDYPLEASFAFHEEAVRRVRVGGYRMRFAQG